MPKRSSAPEVHFIEGTIGTGKTQLLVKKAAELVCSGQQDETVLVLCANPQAAHAFSLRLNTFVGHADHTAKVIISTPRSLALEILSSETAIRWSGRKPRLLTEFETSFLLEDIKVSGARPRRLKEMLKFFYRSWTELTDEGNWLVTEEEIQVHGLLKSRLSFAEALLEPEAANLAIRYLHTHPSAREICSYDHILVDDFQNLSFASQSLADLVASKSITVAGDPLACVEVFDSYPCSSGFETFLSKHPFAQQTRLDTCHRVFDSAYALRTLLGRTDSETSSTNTDPFLEAKEIPRLVAQTTPAEEFAYIAHAVKHDLDKGIPAEDIMVAVPNDRWAFSIVSSLAEKGIVAHALPDKQPAREDIRDLAKCEPARILTALNLVANPCDAMAWRCWCGYGDHLANSTAWSGLYDWATERCLKLVDALATLNSEDMENSISLKSHAKALKKVADAYHAGLTLINRACGLKGKSLLDEISLAVTGRVDSPAASLVASLCFDDKTPVADEDKESGEDACSLAFKARKKMLFPAAPEPTAVLVVPYQLTVGLSPRVLFVSGFMDGFIPSKRCLDVSFDDARYEKLRTVEARKVCSLLGKAEKKLVVTYFTSTDLESADRMGLKIDRIRFEDGVRKACVAPSSFAFCLIDDK